MHCIEIRDLGKCYRHYARPGDRVLEWIGAGPRHEPVWVLRGVNLQVSPGEALAIVGANGAGKSTLLRLVNGTLSPTTGSVETRGRMAALELGLGFHPDFSGRENVFTAGAVLGIDSTTIERLLPEIEDFAEIGSAVGEPVRTYSAGMRLRLAFSLATAVRPDVLLIDEALAVGDVYFQQKCIARIREFRRQGSTLLLVSHDAMAVKTLCDRALLLDRGLPVRDGPTDEVLDYYNAVVAKQTIDYEIHHGEGDAGQRTTRSGDGRAWIEDVTLLDPDGETRGFRVGSTMRVRVDGRARTAVSELTVGLAIRDRLGNEVFGTNTHNLRVASPRLAADQAFRAEFELPVNLGCGHYSLTIALHSGSVHLEGSYDWWDNVRAFQVIPGSEPAFVGCAHLPTTVRMGALEATDSENRIAEGQGR